MELFHSLQGEGAHAGKSAFFIRLAQCKVGCSWCDTKESWSSFSYPKIKIETLAKETAIANSNGASLLIITGGEPLHHNLTPLCEAIRKVMSFPNIKNMPIHIETSGVDPISGSPDWITLSPKRHFPPRAEIVKNCQEIKVIIHTKEDIIFAERIAQEATKTNSVRETNSKSAFTPLLFLQPRWGSKAGEALAMEHVMKNPKWRLSLQTHKWLNID